MSVQYDLDRLGKRFKYCFYDDTGRPLDKPRPLFLNAKDVENYNNISQFYADQQSRQAKDHHLFARLFIYVYRSLLEKYKATVFSKVPKMALHDILTKSTAQHAEEFSDYINDSKLYGAVDMAQMPDLSWVHISFFEESYREKGMEEPEIWRRIAKIKREREEAGERLEEILRESPEISDAFFMKKKLFTFEESRDNLEKMINASINHYLEDEN